MLNEQGWLLTVALFLPVAGAAVLAAMPAQAEQTIKRVAVAITGVGFALAAVIAAGFDYGASASWINAIGARYHLGHRRHQPAAVLPDLPADRSCARSTPPTTCRRRASPRPSWPDAAAADRHGRARSSPST
jgi:hypothetical protein